MLNKVFNYLQKNFTEDFTTLNKVEISHSALLHNFDFYKSIDTSKQIIPVLKSNAYGCGIETVTEILKDRNFPYVAVDGYYEALRVRSISKQPVLIMGYIHPDNYKKINYDNFTFVVHDEITIRALGGTGRKVKVHLEINTGMNRHGIRPDEAKKYIDLISVYKNLELEGIMSHFADADNPDNYETEKQTKIFDETVKEILSYGVKPTWIHLAQSTGALKARSQYDNAFRIGVGLYGINPLDSKDAKFEILEKLVPVLTLKSTIDKVNILEPGEKVSYNYTFKASQKTKIGVLPIGYYEGVIRDLSNKGFVKYKDQFAPIIGIVCMNHTMIDITGTYAKQGDEVTIISPHKNDKNSLENIAKQCEISPYVLTTGINENIRRFIVD